MALRDLLVHAAPRLSEANEVRIRVEDDDPEARVEEQALEDDTERVGLPGPGLAAEERVAVEPSRVETGCDTRREPKLADLQSSPGWTDLLEPRGNLLRVGTAHEGVVERRPVAVPDYTCGPDDSELEGRVDPSAFLAGADLGPVHELEPEVRELPRRVISPSSTATYPPIANARS